METERLVRGQQLDRDEADVRLSAHFCLRLVGIATSLDETRFESADPRDET